MPAYTLPFSVPQRVSGPGSEIASDITLPEMFFQQCVFSNGGRTRYMILVNGPQADVNESWNPAGGTPGIRAYLHVMKSVDGGATWSEVGTVGAKELIQANGSDPTDTTGFRSFSAVQFGSKILVARAVWDFVTNASANPKPIVVSQFDMDQDDWGADLSTDSDVNAPQAYITYGLYPSYTPFFLIRRPSDGHLFLEWRFFDLVDNSKSGTDLVVEAAGVSTNGTDLFIGASAIEVGSTGYSFVPGDVGKVLNIPTASAGAGFVPGNYAIIAVDTGIATVDRDAGILGAAAGTWVLSGANQVSSAANPFDADDVNKVLAISAHLNFNAGNYGISAVDSMTGIATVYHVGAPVNQQPGTVGANGATWSITNQTREYERTMLSEFDGSAWGVAQMIFGTVGDLIDYEPAGLALGDSNRIHCFAQKMNPLLNGNGQANTTESILSKTLLSDDSLVGSQSFEVTDRAPTLPLYRPYSRRLQNGTTELILPYTFIYSPPSLGQSQNCELRVYRGMSADTPTFTSDVVSTGNATIKADGFDPQFGSYPVACDLSTSTLYLMSDSPSGQGAPLFNPYLLNLFTNTSWDAGVPIWDDSAGVLIGPVAAANNYLGFIGMALTNGPEGDFQYDDVFYFELAFAGGCPKNAQGRLR